MPHTPITLTPAERERYKTYYSMSEFGMGYDDVCLGNPNARRPIDARKIKEKRAYIYGSECALARKKHHIEHRGSNHLHVCESCSFSWWHSEKSTNCPVCHTCPECGKADQYDIYKYLSLKEEAIFITNKITTLTKKPSTLLAMIEVQECLKALARIKKKLEAKGEKWDL